LRCGYLPGESRGIGVRELLSGLVLRGRSERVHRVRRRQAPGKRGIDGVLELPSGVVLWPRRELLHFVQLRDFPGERRFVGVWSMPCGELLRNAWAELCDRPVRSGPVFGGLSKCVLVVPCGELLCDAWAELCDRPVCSGPLRCELIDSLLSVQRGNIPERLRSKRLRELRSWPVLESLQFNFLH